MRKALLGLSMMAEPDFVTAILPLLENNEIEVLEWSFDTFYGVEEPQWLSNLLNFYAENNRLMGHGVYYSLLNAVWTDRHHEWLENLKKETQKRRYTHITEHFGFMNTENFHQGIPLPLPLNAVTLQTGKDRLQRLQNVLDVPVGIENLAFSFSKQDVEEQGEFLSRLIEDVDGFIILDLHNIYCQAHNFEIDMKELIRLYPLDQVKEIHLSGGSWQESIYSKDKYVRRDTHDDCIPEEIFQILPYVLKQCKNLEYVIIERLGNTIGAEKDKASFIKDFRRAKKIIDAIELPLLTNHWIKKEKKIVEPFEDHLLFEDQKKLTQLLCESNTPEDIMTEKFHYFKSEDWNKEMINTAKNIIKKWNSY